MINWIIGGLIIGATIFIIARTISRMRRSENTCGCSGCSGKPCCSSNSTCSKHY